MKRRSPKEYAEIWKRQEIILEHSGETPRNRDDLCDGGAAFPRY